MKQKKYIKIEEKLGAHNYHPLDVVIKKGKGCWVWDVEGNKYLDCLAAYSAVNQGHCHPKIYKAFIKQAKKLTLTSRAFRNDKLPLLYEKLHKLTGYDKFLPMNSGAEAVETAIKTARKWGYKVKGIEPNKAEIIVASGNFHGRTTTIISFSDDPSSYENYGPYTPGFQIAKYGNLEDFKFKVNNNTVAILVEPIQGEGGVIIPPKGFLKGLEVICKENNILLIVDEIQSGLGRSGKLFAYEYEDVKPDLVVIGKALGGGFYPVSGVLGTNETLGVFEPGTHGSTFGGNPLAAAVAMAALDVIIDENLVERSFELGEYLLKKLKKIKSDKIKEIRGKGLWIGLELNEPARPYVIKLKEKGILVKDTHETIIRIAPPLTAKKKHLNMLAKKIKDVLMD
ncbi:MAG TPA: ornithine--oxo-acid transaminase [Ignavibacteriales bacterium]|nr:ornithine--oxo-acid transaminase [Ignavibacteriales bacterium]